MYLHLDRFRFIAFF